MKTQITFDDELIKKIDEKAKALFISRAAWVNMACGEKIRNDEMMSMIPELFRKLEESKNDDK